MVLMVAITNFFNRLNITFRVPRRNQVDLTAGGGGGGGPRRLDPDVT